MKIGAYRRIFAINQTYIHDHKTTGARMNSKGEAGHLDSDRIVFSHDYQ